MMVSQRYLRASQWTNYYMTRLSTCHRKIRLSVSYSTTRLSVHRWLHNIHDMKRTRTRGTVKIRSVGSYNSNSWRTFWPGTRTRQGCVQVQVSRVVLSVTSSLCVNYDTCFLIRRGRSSCRIVTTTTRREEHTAVRGTCHMRHTVNASCPINHAL